MREDEQVWQPLWESNRTCKGNSEEHIDWILCLECNCDWLINYFTYIIDKDRLCQDMCSLYLWYVLQPWPQQVKWWISESWMSSLIPSTCWQHIKVSLWKIHNLKLPLKELPWSMCKCLVLQCASNVLVVSVFNLWLHVSDKWRTILY